MELTFSLTFSRNVPKMAQQAIQSRVRVKAVDHHEKYLGLPALIGRSKKLVFSMVRDKVLEKL